MSLGGASKSGAIQILPFIDPGFRGRDGVLNGTIRATGFPALVRMTSSPRSAAATSIDSSAFARDMVRTFMTTA